MLMMMRVRLFLSCGLSCGVSLRRLNHRLQRICLRRIGESEFSGVRAGFAFRIIFKNQNAAAIKLHRNGIAALRNARNVGFGEAK